MQSVDPTNGQVNYQIHTGRPLATRGTEIRAIKKVLVHIFAHLISSRDDRICNTHSTCFIAALAATDGSARNHESLAESLELILRREGVVTYEKEVGRHLGPH